MKHGFRHTKFAEDEQVLFGPVQTAQDSNLSVSSDRGAGEVTHTSLRLVCVTNQRVVVESGDACITLPNRDVQTVFVRRGKQPNGKEGLMLKRIESKFGQRIRLDIPNLAPDDEAELVHVFPNAELRHIRGLRWLWVLALALVVTVPLLCALTTFFQATLDALLGG